MSELTKNDRTTALGLFNYARSYRGSGDYLLAAKLKVTHPLAPVTFLFYHATELYLKSYLRAVGKSVAQLRSIGHNIRSLAVEAKSNGLLIDEEDDQTIQVISEDNNVIRSRYIETGAFSRPEEQALSRLCAILDQRIAIAFRERGLNVRSDTTTAATDKIDTDEIKEELNELTAKEKEIIAYLLHKNNRLFTADLDGGHAATLISRGIVRNALRPGQAFSPEDVPMEIPRQIWTLLKSMAPQFPYEGDEDDPYPWRVGFYERL
jgi:hypothetical protein